MEHIFASLFYLTQSEFVKIKPPVDFADVYINLVCT